MKYLLFTLLSSCGFSSLFTQSLQIYPNVLVEQNANTIQNPFAGGLNFPMLSSIDLNVDGKEDLFLFDKSGNFVSTFVNTGITGQISFVYAPQYASAFPPLRAWVLLRDYNCDGKPDIFTTGAISNHIYVYTNTTTGGNLSFAGAAIGPLAVGTDTIYVADSDVPAIDDIDGDGDLDILTYESQGLNVWHYDNLSLENHQNCQFLEYQLASKCWGKFKEDGLSNVISLNENCPTLVSGGQAPSTRHSGSTITTFDADANGVKEALIGDISYNNIIYLHNGGTNTAAFMNQNIYNFPDYDTPINLTIFPATYLIDVDNDSKKDLFVSSCNPAIGVTVNSLHYYHNNSTGSNTTFTKTADDFLQHEMIDCGSASKPVFQDINADGLWDIVVGNDSYKSGTSQQYADLTVYLNIGTNTQPSFRLLSREYLNIKTLFASLLIANIHPTFGDLDADGDADLIIGDFEGHLHWFENVAGAGNPANYQLKQQQFANIDVGASAMPMLADVSGDGKLDLVIGEQMGNLNYFENVGSTTLPQFSVSPNNNNFGNIDVQTVCCTGYSSPFLFKNVANQWELLLGTEFGEVWHYDNISNNLNGTFHLINQHFGNMKTAGRCAIAGADIDNDGSAEWVVGNMRGGLELFTSQGSIAITSSDNATFHLYPNPANEQIMITTVPSVKASFIEVFTILGTKIYSQAIFAGDDTHIIDSHNWEEGLYWMKVEGEYQKVWIVR